MRPLIVSDHHHSGLYRSLQYLFDRRLGYQVARPIGMEWLRDGLWGVTPYPETAQQFLGWGQAYNPPDGTAALNTLLKREPFGPGTAAVLDPGEPTMPHVAVTLPWVLANRSSVAFVLCSIPQHIEPYAKLAADLGAPLLVHAGNNWPIHTWRGRNVLAATAPYPVPAAVNVCWISEEFSLEHFRPGTPADLSDTPQVASFIHCPREDTRSWRDTENLTHGMGGFASVLSYGAQSPLGCVDGDAELGAAMRRSWLGLHLKSSGDGYGITLHQWAASGRPLIVRTSQYAGQLGARLLVPDQTCVDLDAFSSIPGQLAPDAAAHIRRLLDSPERLASMGAAMADRFASVVDFPGDAERVRTWLASL